MLLRTATMFSLLLAAPSGVGTAAAAHAAAYQGNPNAWVIGPIIRGRSRSSGVPLHPASGPGRGWHIDLPQYPGSVHYVTFPHGSLAGKRRIVMRYRIEAAPGVRIEAKTAPGTPGMITAYFQRRGDNWSGRGLFETYRWYATFATHSPVTRGEHVIVAPLNANWSAIQTSNARNNPAAFQAALAEAGEVGFVMGGGDGYGHGAYATGPARLIVTDFRVE